MRDKELDKAVRLTNIAAVLTIIAIVCWTLALIIVLLRK